MPKFINMKSLLWGIAYAGVGAGLVGWYITVKSRNGVMCPMVPFIGVILCFVGIVYLIRALAAFVRYVRVK